MSAARHYEQTRNREATLNASDLHAGVYTQLCTGSTCRFVRKVALVHRTLKIAFTPLKSVWFGVAKVHFIAPIL
jgi:hypothetical protein